MIGERLTGCAGIGVLADGDGVSRGGDERVIRHYIYFLNSTIAFMYSMVARYSFPNPL